MTDHAVLARRTYTEKLRDPRWQKKRLKILERDGWMCQSCCDSDSTLHVHHRYYTSGLEPWEHGDAVLVALCENCHTEESERRPKAEEALLLATRRYFWHEETLRLALSIINGVELTPRASPMVIISAICYTLDHPELQKEMIDRYFAAIEDSREVAGLSYDPS